MAVGRVLALRALGLGDALTGVPALRGLRRRYPRAELVLAAPRAPGDLLQRLGVVDSLLETSGLKPFELKPADTEHLAVNLHGRGPESHRLLRATGPARLVAFADAVTGTPGPYWRAGEHEVERWCRLVRSDGGACGPEDLRLDPGPLPLTPFPGAVVIHPGAASPSRRWPAGRWRAVARALAARGERVVVTGGPTEAALSADVAGGDVVRGGVVRGGVVRGGVVRGGVAGSDVARGDVTRGDVAGGDVAGAVTGALDLGGRLDLLNLAATVAGARMVLSGDTGVAHLATAFGTPSVTLFGPVSPALWGPAVDHDRHRVLWSGPHTGDPHGSVLDPALAQIRVEDVLEAAASLY